MKRHPSLASLSRDHHHALVFARDAREWPAHGQGAAAFIEELKGRFERDLAPHFEVEERELATPSVSCGEPFASLAARVLSDHDALRALVASLGPESLAAQCEAFGALLEEHVRFEEREWFPALEEQLPAPRARMPKLPADVVPYKSTAVFDARSVPAGLKRSHALKADTWGEIVVEQGQVLYVLEDEGDLGVVLRSGDVGVIAPERPHHVDPDDDARFFVRFSKRGA